MFLSTQINFLIISYIGCNIFSQDFNGATALHYAISFYEEKIFHLLNFESRELLNCCGYKRCKKFNTNNNCNRLLKCSVCRTVAYCSIHCQKNDWKIHKKKCCSSFKDGLINTVDSDGNTVLHICCMFHTQWILLGLQPIKSIIWQIIQANIDVNVINKEGCTADYYLSNGVLHGYIQKTYTMHHDFIRKKAYILFLHWNKFIVPEISNSSNSCVRPSDPGGLISNSSYSDTTLSNTDAVDKTNLISENMNEIDIFENENIDMYTSNFMRNDTTPVRNLKSTTISCSEPSETDIEKPIIIKFTGIYKKSSQYQVFSTRELHVYIGEFI